MAKLNKKQKDEQTKLVSLYLVNVGRFVAERGLDPDDVQKLFEYLFENHLEPTHENLEKADSALTEALYRDAPEVRPVPQDSLAGRSHGEEVAKMGADEYKKRLMNDPEFRAREEGR